MPVGSRPSSPETTTATRDAWRRRYLMASGEDRAEARAWLAENDAAWLAENEK